MSKLWFKIKCFKYSLNGMKRERGGFLGFVVIVNVIYFLDNLFFKEERVLKF